MGASDSFYSMADDRALAIQGRKSPVATGDRVALGSSNYQPGTYTIGVEKVEGVFARGQNIYLKDKQTGTVTNLSQGSYSFTADAGKSLGRFEIVYEAQNVLDVAASVKDDLTVYRDGQDFIITSASKKITRLEVYDGAGRLVRDESPNHIKAVLDAAEMLPGLYILKITQGDTITSKKILK